jgi:divalent metal cation (Fe/Co/Zn/Cd) transporter
VGALTGAAPARQVETAIRVSGLSIVWGSLVGTAALIAGVRAGAVALIGFGAGSLVDATASVVLVWRFRLELVGRADTDRLELRATRAVGAVLVLVGLYLAASAIAELAGGSAPKHSTLGIVLTAASLLVLPLLGRWKLRLAGVLGSRALHGDGLLSLAGAALATATLASVALDQALGWWWSDAIAALAIAVVLAAEGARMNAVAHGGGA